MSTPDWVLANAVIESFTIHARVITVFLYPDESARRADDVTSDMYVADVKKWHDVRGAIPTDLKAVIARTGKEIGHLTTLRHASGAPEKIWRPGPILQALDKPLENLLGQTVGRRLAPAAANVIRTRLKAIAPVTISPDDRTSAGVPTRVFGKPTDISTPGPRPHGTDR
jgi:hypothetical protein